MSGLKRDTICGGNDNRCMLGSLGDNNVGVWRVGNVKNIIFKWKHSNKVVSRL